MIPGVPIELMNHGTVIPSGPIESRNHEIVIPSDPIESMNHEIVSRSDPLESMSDQKITDDDSIAGDFTSNVFGRGHGGSLANSLKANEVHYDQGWNIDETVADCKTQGAHDGNG